MDAVIARLTISEFLVGDNENCINYADKDEAKRTIEPRIIESNYRDHGKDADCGQFPYQPEPE
jgi:hypothetical protein